jgi:hypothetical protein
MDHHKRVQIGIGILVATIALIALYFSYRSYTQIDVNKKDASSTSVTTAKSASKKAKSQKNIFLQNKQDPDRIIGIHPNGSDGVYQYRKQANGTIYPEYKFFDGNVSANGNKLNVAPNNSERASQKMSYVSTGNGEYRDEQTGAQYQKVNIATEEKSSTDQNDGKVAIETSYSNPLLSSPDVEPSNQPSESSSSNVDNQLSEEIRQFITSGQGKRPLSDFPEVPAPTDDGLNSIPYSDHNSF